MRVYNWWNYEEAGNKKLKFLAEGNNRNIYNFYSNNFNQITGGGKMKHPHKSGRGKHFTSGKYKSYLLDGDKLKIVKDKIRKTSKARVRICKYDGFLYKVRYNNVKLIKQKEQG